jgi:hypothetical protein
MSQKLLNRNKEEMAKFLAIFSDKFYGTDDTGLTIYGK